MKEGNMRKPGFTGQITFLHAEDLQKTKAFYADTLGLKLSRDQKTCLIFQVSDSAYLGFCEHIEFIDQGRKLILTLVTDDVNAWYRDLVEKNVEIIEPPKANPTYQIYHFFFKDPDGYWVEIQRFDKPL
jgi:catechol 2,3-dioxygenase-like lactoylglutathione lyase family enzyme